MSKKKFIFLTLVLLIVGFVYFISVVKNSNPNNPEITKTTETKDPSIISTNPNPLEGVTILSSQTIELIFNQPLENRGELKLRFEPKFTDYDIYISNDKKTAQIIATKPYNLGTTYTLFILPDTKFDGKKTLNKDIMYHFKTIGYRGV